MNRNETSLKDATFNLGLRSGSQVRVPTIKEILLAVEETQAFSTSKSTLESLIRG